MAAAKGRTMRILIVSFTLLQIFMSIEFSFSAENKLSLYTGLRENSKNYKIVKKRVIEAFKKIGHKVEINSVPKVRALNVANLMGDGDIHRLGYIKEIFPEITNNLVKVNESISHGSKTYVFVLKGNEFKISGWDSLKRFKNNGILKGIMFLEKKVPNFWYVRNTEQLGKMLVNGRIDTVIIPLDDLKVS